MDVCCCCVARCGVVVCCCLCVGVVPFNMLGTFG